MSVTWRHLAVSSDAFKLSTLLEADLLEIDEDVEDIPRYQAAVPRSARFNWLARAPDVCLSNTDDAAFDPTCVADEATIYLPMLVPEEWPDFCPPGDAA